MNERLKKLRKTLGLTQKEFADRIGGKRNTIAKYETSVNIPSTAVISLICREFSVNEEWLRNGTGDMFIVKTKDENIATFVDDILNGKEASFKKQFMSMLSELDESDWKSLRKMVDLLQEKRD